MPDSPIPPRLGLMNYKLWWAALIVYWLALLTATHVPSDFPGLPSDGWDKVVHFGAFAVLAMLLATAWQFVSAPLSKTRLIGAWALIACYAALDEWTQGFVGRDSSVYDWLADAAGAAVGLAAFVWLRYRMAKRQTV